MPVNKARGQSESNLVLLMKVNDGATATEVSPEGAADDITVTDTGNGDYSVAVKNFKGRRGLVNIVVTTTTISVFASVSSATYSGDTLTFVLKIENDASTATNSSVYVRAEAF